MTRRKIASHYALIGTELRRNIVVEVDDSRMIIDIREVENLDTEPSLEFFPGILIPGMVNLHCHLELSYLRGQIAEGTGFAGFARSIGAVRNNFTTDERLRAASAADSTMWEEGIEAVLDISNDELTMGIKERSRIEYTTLFELFGLGCNSIEEHKSMALRHASCSITPHSTYSLQDQIFRQACIANNSTISIHLLESDDESQLYENGGSLAAWYERMGWRCDFLHYGTPSRRVAESIDPHRDVVLVHGCRATEHDIALLNAHFMGQVTWALCPESNRYISGIKPPIELFRANKANIALGSDSLASARSLSLIDNMRLIDNVPLSELLSYATINGAKALGKEEYLGEIAIGKCPGLVVIEGADLHNLRLTEESRSRRII